MSDAITCAHCFALGDHNVWCISLRKGETQAQADKRYREHYAREDFNRMKDEIAHAIEAGRKQLVKWQREGEHMSTLIRDYAISIEKLQAHLERMKT